MFKKLLVALDGSACSERAFQFALSLAREANESIALCTVVDANASADATSAARRVLDDAIGVAKAAGVSCHGETLFGKPAETIVGEAKARGADAIVTGTHGRSGMNRLFAGSVAESVLRQSPIPVIVLREATRLALDVASAKLLVPVDGSEYSDRAVDTAIDMAEALKGEVVVCNVVDLAQASTMTAGDAQLIAACLDALEAEGKSFVNDAVTHASPRVKTSSIVRQGFPIDEINKLAAETGAACIVIGTHGRGGLQRAVMGSVAEGVVRESNVPVVVVTLPRSQAGREVPGVAEQLSERAGVGKNG